MSASDYISRASEVPCRQEIRHTRSFRNKFFKENARKGSKCEVVFQSSIFHKQDKCFSKSKTSSIYGGTTQLPNRNKGRAFNNYQT